MYIYIHIYSLTFEHGAEMSNAHYSLFGARR